MSLKKSTASINKKAKMEKIFEVEPALRKVYSNPEAYETADISNFMEFFPEEDYLIKRYDIITPDGYIIGLFRIQNHREHKGVSFTHQKIIIPDFPSLDFL